MNARIALLGLIMIGCAFAAQERYISMGLVSPGTQDMVLSPGQSVLFDVAVKDEAGLSVSNATVILSGIGMNYTSTSLGNGLYEINYRVSSSADSPFLIGITAMRWGNEAANLTLRISISRTLGAEFMTPAQDANVMDSGPVDMRIDYPNGDPVMSGSFAMNLGNKTLMLSGTDGGYHGILNLSGEGYGTKNVLVYGTDQYGNSLNSLLTITYTERKDYAIFFIALLLIAAGSVASYFVYTESSKLSKEYRAFKKERDYLETMDKKTHLEFFKKHIDEKTFKKLVLEYHNKSTDLDRIIASMERKHRWLKRL